VSMPRFFPPYFPLVQTFTEKDTKISTRKKSRKYDFCHLHWFYGGLVYC
jgi:hypothetical protein